LVHSIQEQAGTTVGCKWLGFIGPLGRGSKFSS